MHLSKVSLVNYRNFRSARFLFRPGVNTVIGENGSGKSNLFRAMRLLLDSNIYRAAHELSEGDFFRRVSSWKGHWIIISLEFDNISSDESVQSLFVHHGAVLTGDVQKKATYNLIFRPRQHIRAKLADLALNDSEGLKRLQNEITIDDYETVFTGRSNVDLTNPVNYREVVGDFKSVKFPRGESKLIGFKIPHQLSVSREISFTFVKALRDVVSDFNGNRQNPLLNLLTNKSQEIDKDKYNGITQAVHKLNGDIESLQDVQDVRHDIRKTIRETAGDAYSPASLHIKSDLPTEPEKLLQSLKLFVGETDEDYSGDISELSLGGANLIYLTLKLLEFKYQNQRDAAGNFLIIEEPEAHIHTHIQKTLFENISYENTQIIYSTHSTHVSEVSNIESVNILARNGLRCESYQPSMGLHADEIRHLQRYLDATRSSLLFARAAILIEGDAEEFLIPVLVKKVLGVSLDELGISLINIRSTGFENIACIFHKARVRRRCSIITDMDAAISDTRALISDSKAEKSFKKKMRGSELKGKARKIKLESYCQYNQYLQVYYASHTFEVDFLMADNSFEVSGTLKDVYLGEAHRITSGKELESVQVGVAGRRILKMANHVGKGWFAILLADRVSRITNIPKYILNAVLDACDSLAPSTAIKILKYRLNTLVTESYFEDHFDSASESQSLIKAYEDGDVDFTDLMSALEIVLVEDPVSVAVIGA
ncbi:MULTISPECIES: ATP-dependent endonuclease [unclassified Pseudomonas]|uniref:ATP-dependent nuclease n=1 Tax=unclassified Pseudomonas TaxID=196821 RepID=UPI000871399D|nr:MULTISPECIES: AAA family ATPase [unclassified Pseudomonas]SCW94057.1 Predicted ATP-dependent endonuclease of the OLD family, contains P-loop ATPase and TOPRIM domains [Pseudomonas sp. NFACC56-3]SFK54368.1 Predicted ATP-dependent endonuclease of the OLD family, contains P-loop ATPase and TOPRIM domains [Pseudomonas sp. NFACC52]